MKKSYWIAGGILLGVVVWMASGQLGGGQAPDSAGVAAAPHRELTRVRTQMFSATPVTREVVFSGTTEPARSVELRAETVGQVAALPVARGAWVKQGEVLIRLAEDNRGARLREAQALVHQRELEYRAAQRLRDNNLIAETAVAQARTALESAQATQGAAELELTRSIMRAPFDGVLDTRRVELGAYVREGDVVARVVDLDPLLVAGAVSEQDVGKLRVGAEGSAQLVTGEKLRGAIRYIAAAADAATHTFRVELEVANPERLRTTGVTAEVRIELEPLAAHKVSPAMLALDDRGAVGVKSVGADGVVVFHPANIIRSEPDGLWLAGLPEQLRLITVGQGFVRAGERVEASEQAVAR